MKEEGLPKLSFKILLPLLVLSFVVGFYFFGFTFDASCPKCNGTGKVWETRYDFDVDTWVTGYWPCPTCLGSGKIHFFSPVSYATVFFVGFVFCFLLFFALEYGVTAFRLDRNPWVKDVKEMHFWFNPMYWIWVFHVDRKKWVKWTTALVVIAALMVVSTIAMPLMFPSTPAMGQNIFVGWLIGSAFLVLFAVAWYQSYEDLSIPFI